MKTVVMTGATSFLGRHVLKGLLEEDYKVFALVRETSAAFAQLPQSNKVDYIYGALDGLDGALKGIAHADIFIHFAWDGSGNAGRADREVQFKNIEYSMKALELSERLGCEKFIFPGSQAEYGIVHGKITEDTPCNPVSEYGKVKLEFSKQAEKICSNRKIKFIHLRIFSVYGLGDREGTLVDDCIRKFNSSGDMVLGPCMQKWNYLNIADFVNAIKTIFKLDNIDGIYNIASQDTRILQEFVKEIYGLSNRTGSYRFDGIATNPEGSPELDPDITKIMDATGWVPKISFTDGIIQIMDAIKRRDR